MPHAKARPHRIDGNEYSVSISVTEIGSENTVHLCIALRAEFGTRSVCIIRGVTNRSYWHDYPNIDEMKRNSISITPRVVSLLIRWSHQQGWQPSDSKSNLELHATKEMIESLGQQPDN